MHIRLVLLRRVPDQLAIGDVLRLQHLLPRLPEDRHDPSLDILVPWHVGSTKQNRWAGYEGWLHRDGGRDEGLIVRLLATVLLTTTLVLLTLLLMTAMLTVLSIALPSLSVVPWAAWTVVTSGTVLRSGSGSCTNTGMVTRRVILDAALVGVQIRALRPEVTVLARSDYVRLAQRPGLLLLASLIPLSTTGWCSTIAGLTLHLRHFRRVFQSPCLLRRPLLHQLGFLLRMHERFSWSLRHVR